eukprot:CAMPEP_0177274888 /NCGR_PEP_ID=MMETSP0367-20130122/67410_1 /TAXON_ID=447022 ORGANISM="Scrippsiella hangoei-like, Strain SHHI-4" /NCGR_SAMPLE_ID=MMETSP0367 /ASSEMBLY_ACC=CAM_ASM_000362 /LENGTH=138 /DNA_ID=CAMNT_0018731259 /DNA_START=1 /DNA_END=417 /DNA_ORIENTATION=-
MRQAARRLHVGSRARDHSFVGAPLDPLRSDLADGHADNDGGELGLVAIHPWRHAILQPLLHKPAKTTAEAEEAADGQKSAADQSDDRALMLFVGRPLFAHALAPHCRLTAGHAWRAQPLRPTMAIDAKTIGSCVPLHA